MFVTCRRNVILTHPTTGEHYTLRKSTSIGEFSEVPDWIAETDYFKLCEQDGTVKRVEVKSPPVQPKKEEPLENIGFGNRVVTGVPHTPSPKSRAALKT